MTTASGYAIRRFSPERGTFGRLLARDSIARRMDWILLAAAVALSLIGSLLVYSATRGRTSLTHGDQYYFLVRHLLNAAIGMGLAVGTVARGHRRRRVAVA
jgi:rod shape determining protein RodA